MENKEIFITFGTYSVHGLENTAPDGFQIPFSAGNTRRNAPTFETRRTCGIRFGSRQPGWARNRSQLVPCFKLAMAQPSF
jgi:hypothetical protein